MPAFSVQGKLDRFLGGNSTRLLEAVKQEIENLARAALHGRLLSGNTMLTTALDVEETLVSTMRTSVMARHIIMDPSGHSTFEFDKDNPVALAEAERRFYTFVGKGYVPAEMRGGGKHHVPDKSNRSFNPNAEETIFIPALRGG